MGWIQFWKSQFRKASAISETHGAELYFASGEPFPLQCDTMENSENNKRNQEKE